MQSVDNTWERLFGEPTHKTEIRAFIDGAMYSMDKIYNAVLTRSVFTNNVPEVGCCCASTFDIEIIPDSRIPRMAPIIVQTRLKSADGVRSSEWIPTGTFFVDTRRKERVGTTMRFTAYDSMLKADQPYLPNSSITNWPAAEALVVAEIASCMGVSVDSRTTLAGYSVDYPQDYTMREVLGYIAAANGGNWIITPENKLLLVKLHGENSLLGANYNAAILFGDTVVVLSTGYNYDAARSLLSKDDDEAILMGDSLVVLDGQYGLRGAGTDIQRNAKRFQNLGLLQPFSGVKVWYSRQNSYVDTSVGGVTQKVEVENAYFAGTNDGRVLELDCPWGTQAMANAILTQIDGFCYQGAIVEGAQMTPAAELGDLVICDGVGFSLSLLSVTYTGDYLPTISAPADEEVDYEYHYETPTERKLNRTVALGDSYYGFKVTRENGIEVVNIVDGTETTRMILNSSVQAFYNADGQEALYFDAEAGEYRFVGDVTVLSGSLNINDNFIVDVDGHVTCNGSVTLQGSNTKIVAPEILATSFNVFPSDATDVERGAETPLDGFNLYGRESGQLYHFLNIHQTNEYVYFYSPASGYAYWGFGSTTVSGGVNFSGSVSMSGAAYYYGHGATLNNEIATLGDVAAMIAAANQ